MAQRRTDLAVEAHQLWREGAGGADSLPGVRALEEDREGFPVTTVSISSQEAAQALLAQDPQLSAPENRPVLARVRQLFADTPDIFN